MQPKYQHLYLKEYFTNFFIRKENQQQTNLLRSSLEVLSELITQFISSHSINIGYKKTKNNGLTQEYSLQNLFQQIYFQIKCVFEWIQLQGNLGDSRRSGGSEVEVRGDDDELYGILNEYKIGNKKLRAQLKQAHIRIEQLQNQNNKIQQQSKQIASELSNKINLLQIQSNNLLERVQSQNLQLQQKFQQTNKQSVYITQLQNQSTNKQQTIAELHKQICSLQQKCQSYQQKIIDKENYLKVCEQKYGEKYRELVQKIPEMIESKLHQDKRWEIPVYKGLVKYLKSTNKQNYPLQQNKL